MTLAGTSVAPKLGDVQHSIYYQQIDNSHGILAMQIRFGFRDLEFPSAQLSQLRECQDLIGDAAGLWQRMNEDGYLLVRGLIDRDTVLSAREAVLRHMHEQQALLPDTPVLEGVMPQGGRSVRMMGGKGIAHRPAVLSVLEYPALFDLFKSLFGEPALTFPFKWMRAIGNEQYTGAHFDFVYMGRGSQNLYTTWIPFGDIPISQGTLAICRGSHNFDSFARIRSNYGKMDIDRDGISGWFEARAQCKSSSASTGNGRAPTTTPAMSLSLPCIPCTPQPPTSLIASG